MHPLHAIPAVRVGANDMVAAIIRPMTHFAVDLPRYSIGFSNLDLFSPNAAS